MPEMRLEVTVRRSAWTSGLVPEVFRHHPLDLAVAFDDNWQAGSLVPNHRLVNALLESLQNQTAVFQHDAIDALVHLRSRVIRRHRKRLLSADDGAFNWNHGDVLRLVRRQIVQHLEADQLSVN